MHVTLEDLSKVEHRLAGFLQLLYLFAIRAKGTQTSIASSTRELREAGCLSGTRMTQRYLRGI